jgi:hypothetical protein
VVFVSLFVSSEVYFFIFSINSTPGDETEENAADPFPEKGFSGNGLRRELVLVLKKVW